MRSPQFFWVTLYHFAKQLICQFFLVTLYRFAKYLIYQFFFQLSSCTVLLNETVSVLRPRQS